MKVLCYINHFFGQNPHFLGKSSLPPGTNADEMRRRAGVRKQTVEKVVAQLKQIEGAEVRVCGIEGFSLVPLDVNFEAIRQRPLWMIYESLNHMAQFVDQYDYFVNVEDDLLLPEETFANVVEFDRQSLINEILLPNRLESAANGVPYCVDLMAIKGWTQQRMEFKGRQFRVALNPHSACLIMSQEKLRYALARIDRSYRAAFLYNELDSAFAHFHSPFSLFRCEDLTFHTVVHLDRWLFSDGEAGDPGRWKRRFASIRASDFVPPIVARLLSHTRRKLSARWKMD